MIAPQIMVGDGPFGQGWVVEVKITDMPGNDLVVVSLVRDKVNLISSPSSNTEFAIEHTIEVLARTAGKDLDRSFERRKKLLDNN